MIKKRIMLMGAVGCGKTTLCQLLNDIEGQSRKTQTIQIINNTIDTPGEYMENRGLYKALVVTAVDAELILFLQSAVDQQFRFSPGQASMFGCPVAGVVTKTDLASPDQTERAKELLELSGARPIFSVSSITGEGIDRLKQSMENYIE